MVLTQILKLPAVVLSGASQALLGNWMAGLINSRTSILLSMSRSIGGALAGFKILRLDTDNVKVTTEMSTAGTIINQRLGGLIGKVELSAGTSQPLIIQSWQSP